MKKEWTVWVTGSNMAKCIFIELEQQVMRVVEKAAGCRSRIKNCASRNQ